MTRRCGLARSERIRRRPEFEHVYAKGTRIHARFMTLFVTPNATPHPRLGVAATRKLGTAVDRNRAKRLARELFRRHKDGPVFDAQRPLDVVVVPRREMLDAPFVSLESDYAAALERCRKHVARIAKPGAGRSGSRPA